MGRVHLHGELVCTDAGDAATVATHIARHTALTRAEPGCLSFEVTPTDDPLVWVVDEWFADAAAFTAHQERSAASEWGQATAEIRRRYAIDGL